MVCSLGLILPASSALSTPVRNPYLPVRIAARVGEHTGLVHTLVKRMPSSISRSSVGIWGFCSPKGYLGTASTPKSSAIIKSILERLVFVVGGSVIGSLGCSITSVGGSTISGAGLSCEH